MKLLNITGRVLVLAACGLVAGCAQHGEPTAEATSETHTAPEATSEAAPGAVTPAAVPATPTAGATAKDDAAKTPAEPGKAPAIATAKVEPFKPPYPERDNMFRRPNTDNTKTARAENNTAVELKGFVNVGGLRAVLVIDGNTVSMKQGDQRGEISVIEISPPKVILQRGRNRWTTQLFDPKANQTAAAK